MPNEAVQTNGDTGTVFVINGNTVERRVVRLGTSHVRRVSSCSRAFRPARVSSSAISMPLTDGAKVYVDTKAASQQGEGS